MFAAIGRGVVRRPWLVIAGWLIAAAAIIGTAPSLSQVTNSDQAAFLPDDAESARAGELAKRAFPETDRATAVIVVKRADGAPLGTPDLATLGELAQRLNVEKPAAVRGVLFDPKQTVAPKREVALLSVQFTGAPEEERVRDAVTDIREMAADTLDGSGLTAGVTGEAAIVVDNKAAFAEAERIVTIATLALIVVLLLVIFRSPVAALLPLLSVGLVFGIAQAVIAAAGTAFDFEVGQELPTMLTVVLFGIGTDYILFLLFRFRERLRAGDDARTAIVAAVERVGEAIFSAAFAVIAAFGALVLALLGFFTTLGPALAIGTAVMLLAALTLVPAIVSLCGEKTFWPATRRFPSGERPDTPHALATAAGGEDGLGTGGFARLGRLVARRPVAVVVVSLALLGGLASAAVGYQANYDPIDQLPDGTESQQAFDDLQAGFPAGAVNPTQVYLTGDKPLSQQQIAAITQRLVAVEGVASPLRPQVGDHGRTVVVPLVLDHEPYGDQAMDLASGPLRNAAHAAAAAVAPGTEVLIGGQSASFADVRDTTNRDLRVVFAVAALLFFLILAGLLRALLAPLYLVIMVVLGFAATLGATTLLFQRGLGHAGLSFIIPIILYLFVTAIGTDYNILVTARLREEIREGRDRRQAAAAAVAHAGPSVAAAAVILAGTFGSLLISGVSFFVEIGFAVTVGIMLVASVVSLLLVPAVSVLAGRAAWWPGGKGGAGREAGAGKEQPALSGAARFH